MGPASALALERTQTLADLKLQGRFTLFALEQGISFNLSRVDERNHAVARSSDEPNFAPINVYAFDPAEIDRKSTRLNSITTAHLVCRLLLDKKTRQTTRNY